MIGPVRSALAWNERGSGDILLVTSSWLDGQWLDVRFIGDIFRLQDDISTEYWLLHRIA